MWFAVLVTNTVPVVCLTLLAVHFEKWWIVLFALLFGVSYKSTSKEDEKDENT
jgi:predicted secreted protein